MIKKFNEYLKENVNMSYDNLIKDIYKSNRIEMVMGSTTFTDYKASIKTLNEYFDTLLKHYFFDWDFYYNYTREYEEYERFFKDNVLIDLKNDIHKYIIKENDVYKINNNIDFRKYIDDYFKKEELSNKIKEDYKKYKKEYFDK